MIVEKIKNILAQENRQIVFYFDTDDSLQEELDDIRQADIEVIEVKNNYFQLKYQLEFENKNKPVFLYHAFARPEDKAIRKYPLLDLLRANVELRLDDISEFLTSYGLADSYHQVVRPYIQVLKTKTNQKKLAKVLEPNQFSEDNLKLGLISIALDFNTVTRKNTCIAKLFILALDEKAFKKALTTIETYSLTGLLISWCNNLFNTSITQLNIDTVKEWTAKCKYNILLQLIDHSEKEDTYTKLKLTNSNDLNRLQSFYTDWQEEKNLSKYIEEVFEELAMAINGNKIISWYGTKEDYGYYSKDMVSDVIQTFYAAIEKSPGAVSEECIKWLRTGYTSQSNQDQIRFIDYAGKFLAILSANKKFEYSTPEEYIKRYQTELYKVDSFYRKALIQFDTIKDTLFEFEEVATQLFELINQKYDRYLIDLNVGWQTKLKEVDFKYDQINADKQYNFYTDNIKSFNNKIVVIISDALRYELGYELYEDLLAESKNNVAIEPSLASIPSYTNLGMSNLLPNTGIELEKGEADLAFKIGGTTTVSTNRAAILKTAEPESNTIDFPTLKRMNKQDKRAFFKENRITYVYHDRVDSTGDKKQTEHQTFDATVKALDDLKWMINNISGEMMIPNILITSDHGFIYNYNDLQETDREVMPKTAGYSREHVRFVVADEFEGQVDGYQMALSSTTNIQSDMKVVVPRAINRFRKQGNVGVQFVHGGASMQELLTPVIKYYKHKKEIQRTVKFKRIDSTDKITSGSLKIHLLQEEPVSNNLKSLNAIFGLYGDDGKLLSNEVEVVFNSVSSNPKERFNEVILSLNSEGSKASFCHLKSFDKKDKAKLNPVGVNEIIKINSVYGEKDMF